MSLSSYTVFFTLCVHVSSFISLGRQLCVLIRLWRYVVFIHQDKSALILQVTTGLSEKDKEEIPQQAC